MEIITQINTWGTEHQFFFMLLMLIVSISSAWGIMWSLYKWSLRFKFFAMIGFLSMGMLSIGAYLFGENFSIIRILLTGVFIGIGSHIAMIIFLKTTLNPLKELVERLEAVSRGDFTVEVDIIKTKDELGQVSKTLGCMVGEISILLQAIKNNTQNNLEMAEDLSELSSRMSENADSSQQRSSVAASSVKDTNANMVSVATTMEEASANISEISTAIEENTIALNEVAQNSAKAGISSDEVASQADSASKMVRELDGAARNISQVTETITEISEQTNLLALNATIEAARAGGAGKGFAVVASEIKELARQTAEATQEIKNMVDGVQKTAANTMAEIEKITMVINNSNNIVTSIVTAVEEQSIVTAEIARNVCHASDGIQSANKNVSQSLTALDKIATDINEVNSDANRISTSSLEVKGNSGKLASLAERLKENVAKFVITE